jgi:hypothetical protein
MQDQHQNNNELIFSAARRGVTSIESLIRKGIDINEVDSVLHTYSQHDICTYTCH